MNMDIVFLSNSMSAVLRHLATSKWKSCLTIVDFSTDYRLRIIAKNLCIRYIMFSSWQNLAEEITPKLLISYKLNTTIPEFILNHSRYGGINIHPSLLPKYRGANPWFEAYCAHDLRGGITIHRLVKELDAGEIIAQGEFQIQHGDPLPISTMKADNLARVLLDNVLDNELYKLPGKPQRPSHYNSEIQLENLKKLDIDHLWHILRGFPQLIHILFPLPHKYFEVNYPIFEINDVDEAVANDGAIVCKGGKIPLIDFSRSAMASDYIEAINDLRIIDPYIKEAEFKRDVDGSIISMQGREAIVFPLDIKGRKYALRCLKNISIDDANQYVSDINSIYTYLREKGITFFIDTKAIPNVFITPKGILPALLMNYCAGNALSTFLIDNLYDYDRLEKLLNRFVEICALNQANGIVHGDLHDGNLRIDDNADITIIDTDNICVNPDSKVIDKGANRLWQHPQRFYDGKLFVGIDSFSEIILYINICCARYAPDLYMKFVSRGNIFSETDYVNPQKSCIMNELSEIPQLKQYTERLRHILTLNNIHDIPYLNEFIKS